MGTAETSKISPTCAQTGANGGIPQLGCDSYKIHLSALSRQIA